MSDITRRRVLAASGVVATGAIAGCLDGDSAEADEGGEDERPDGTILGDIGVENLSSGSHTVDVLVEFGGAIEHWTTHTLDTGSSGAELERTWPTEPSTFRVIARLDEGELTQVTPAKWNEPSCLNLTIMVDRNGELRILSDTSGGPCDEPEIDDDGATDGEDEDGGEDEDSD